MNKVLLTGGTGGIGKAILEKFTSEGLSVCAPKRSELDLASPKSIESFFQKNNAEFDIYIHCAGENDPALIETLPLEKIQQTMQVNTFSLYTILQHLIPYLKRHGGSVVGISSIYGSVSRDGRAAYTMSKHALNGLIKTAAIELGSYGVRVNSVSPGFVDTVLTHKNNSPEKIRSLESKIPLGKMALPEQIANTVYYLSCSNDLYITGQDIIVDGGFLAGGFQL